MRVFDNAIKSRSVFIDHAPPRRIVLAMMLPQAHSTAPSAHRQAGVKWDLTNHGRAWVFACKNNSVCVKSDLTKYLILLFNFACLPHHSVVTCPRGRFPLLGPPLGRHRLKNRRIDHGKRQFHSVDQRRR